MKIQRLVGCILAGLQFVISALLVFFLIRTHVVPSKYIIMGGIILGLLPICFIAMQLRKVSGIIASVMSVLLIGIMVFGIIKVNQANKMMDSVTGNKTEVEVVNVYIAADDPVDSINQAVEKGYKFATIDNINTAQGIDDIYESGEVYTDIIIKVNIIKVLKCCHRHLDTVVTGMCQLVERLALKRKVYIEITWCRKKQDSMCLEVYNSDNVNVTTALECNIAVSIDTTDICTESLLISLGSVSSLRCFLLNFLLDLLLKDYLEELREVLVFLLSFKDTDIACADDHTLNLTTEECLCSLND